MTLHAPDKEALRRRLLDVGACAVGFAKADAVGEGDRRLFDRWLSTGRNAAMGYMHNYPDLRFDPTKLLEGARTVISLAFNYNHGSLRPSSLPYIARFAWVRDYHKALRTLLKPVCRELERDYGCLTRIATDSAPVRERYWALKSGIGIRGCNGMVIIPGVGSYVFLTEIVTTLEVEPDEESTAWCRRCGKCLSSCPGGAILPDGTLDAARCISYRTIEAPVESEQENIHRAVSKGGTMGHLFGCDTCQRVCPHNVEAPTTHLPALAPLPQVVSLTGADVTLMTEEEFRRRMAGTSLLRAGLTRLRANLL